MDEIKNEQSTATTPPPQQQGDVARLEPERPSARKNFFTKKNLIIGSAVFLAILIIAFFALTRNNQQSEETVVAQVGDIEITRADVVSDYNEKYPESPVESFNDISKDYQDGIIQDSVQEVLLQNKAESIGISVSEEEVNNAIEEKMALGIPPEVVNSMESREDLKISLLKKKLEDKLVTFRDMQTATIFVPEGPDFDARFEDAQILLEEFRTEVVNGATFDVAYANAQLKPNFNPGLVIDLQRLTKGEESGDFLAPTAFSLNTGEISEVIDSGGGTLGLVYIVGAGDFDFSTLDEWLSTETARAIIN